MKRLDATEDEFPEFRKDFLSVYGNILVSNDG